MSRFHDEFFGKHDAKHDKLMIKCVAGKRIERILTHFNAKQIAQEMADEGKTVLIKHESEVICKSQNRSSSFILGYADIVITLSNYGDTRYTPLVQILVEVKPELSDIGSTLRQIKTYEDCLRRAPRFYKAIVTHTKVDQDVMEYLAHEGVKVIVFAEVP